MAVPLLDKLPVVGEALFDQSPLFYAAVAVVIAVEFLLRKTRTVALRIRAVGESLDRRGNNDEARSNVQQTYDYLAVAAADKADRGRRALRLPRSVPPASSSRRSAPGSATSRSPR